jgi:CrcB protein
VATTHHASDDWPVDPDVDAAETRLDPWVIAVIAVGGFVGGLARYELVTAWSAAPTSFPWSTFVVNTAGAFVLALLVIVTTEKLAGSTYLRPLIGTGFCGALTTFSSVTVATDELAAHGHLATAIWYVVASLLAGTAAVIASVVIGRALPDRRRAR